MQEPNQTVSAIPGHAREFIKVVRERCGQDLDFDDSSIARLDEIVLGWRSMSRNEKLAISEGMCFYLGEVIRRNLGGCWVDPTWKNPDTIGARCYLTKVGGVLTVTPSKWVKRRLLERRDESFPSYYKRVKQKARSIKKGSRKEPSSSSRGARKIEIDRFTSVVTLFQFVAVIGGWVLCRGCARLTGGDDVGLPGFLLGYGYTLVLIPIVWAPLMIYKNTSGRVPTFIEKPLSAFGFVAIFVIFGLFGWLAVGMIASLAGDSIF
jgi:hypothetical protein